MGTHLRILSESYLMNTNMTGFSQMQPDYFGEILQTKVYS